MHSQLLYKSCLLSQANRLLTCTPSHKLADSHVQDVPQLGKVLHATATSVSGSEIVLSDSTSLPFDYLVLASGSTWADPVCSGTEASLTERRLAQQACHMLAIIMQTNPLTYLYNQYLSVSAPSAVDSSPACTINCFAALTII